MIRIVLALLVGACAWCADDMESLKKRVTELEQEIAALKASSVTYDALNRAKLTMSVSESATGTILPGSAAKLLGLSVEQWAAVSAARAHAKEQVIAAAGLQKPQAVTGNGTLTLALHDFSAEGKPVKDELDRTLSSLLGPARLTFLNTLMKQIDDREFASFGASAVTVTLTDKGNGMFAYSLTRKQGDSTYTTSGPDTGSPGLPDDAAMLSPFIPKSFGGELPDSTEAAPDHGPSKDF